MKEKKGVSLKKAGARVQSEELPIETLRWRCDPDDLSFDSTAEVEPVAGVVGQDDAVEAVRYGLESSSPGQNIFVRGLSMLPTNH